MNRYIIKIFITASIAVLNGCLEMVSLDGNHTPSKKSGSLAHSTYYLAAPQQTKRQFDTNTGASLTQSLTDLSQPLLWGAIVDNKAMAPTKLTLPKEVPTLIIDGLHALSWRGNISAKELYFSRTYAELDGTIAIERLQVGSHPYSIPAHPKPDRDYAASLVIKGTHISSKKFIVDMGSFIDIKEGFYVGSKWRSAPTVRGLVIDSPTSDLESRLLFAKHRRHARPDGFARGRQRRPVDQRLECQIARF